MECYHSKKIKYYRKPPRRVELRTPGLQDQCSNHLAMEAVNSSVIMIFSDKMSFKFKHKSKIQDSSQTFLSHVAMFI